VETSPTAATQDQIMETEFCAVIGGGGQMQWFPIFFISGCLFFHYLNARKSNKCLIQLPGEMA